MSEDFSPTLQSTLTCPQCGAASTCTMPVDACQVLLKCPVCKALLEPKPGDCCVFCSYGDVPCPPVQLNRRTSCAC
ncbi:MAG TPA: GDCCVxC domain-containing (seleno)protein [Thiobacillaceae bacterium]|nr:GDCCVxC domain-containing (seleno)protein [Thiobacillaceae bacterium]